MTKRYATICCMSWLSKFFRRFKYAFAGIFYAVRCDSSMRSQVYLGGLVIAGFIYIASPLTQTEWLLLVFAYGLILITELQNSALETALDHLHPDTHTDVGRSKDLAAGAVLIAGILLGIVIITLIYARWWPF